MPSPTFLTAAWRKLIMANYAVDPKLLQAYLPKGTELDYWQDQCYVSLVGFLFQKVRLKGIPVPFHTLFPEVNLRFYVRHKSPEGWRRGVVFIKEIVPKPALTLVARLLYGEPYETMPMRYQWQQQADSLSVSYSWKQEQWHRLAVEASLAASPIAEGSEAEFITEHYLGYTKLAGHKTQEFEVVHPRWEAYPVKTYQVEADFGLLYGPQFGFLTGAKPQSVLLAEGSRIAVLAGNPLKFR